MNKNMYLNEENYKRINTKIKNVGRLIMVIALIMIIAGFILKVGTMGIEVPKMGSENWFETTSAKSEMEFHATSLIMFGVWLEFVGCIVRYFVGNARQIMAYNLQTTMPIAQEGIKTCSYSCRSKCYNDENNGSSYGRNCKGYVTYISRSSFKYSSRNKGRIK